MEEVIVQMLGRLMARGGVRVAVTSTRTHFAEIAARISKERPVLVFIAALPGGLPQTRYLCTYLHQEFPDLAIVVGYWGDKNNFDQTLVRLRRAGASSLVTSLLQTRSRVHTLMKEVGHTNPAELDSQAVGGGECR
jgi:hypothetical protein